MVRRDEPPEQRPHDEPIRCRHCGETFEEDEDGVNWGDHQDGCPQVKAEEQAAEAARLRDEDDGTTMIIPALDPKESSDGTN